jgi:hypothetical protein
MKLSRKIGALVETAPLRRLAAKLNSATKSNAPATEPHNAGGLRSSVPLSHA